MFFLQDQVQDQAIMSMHSLVNILLFLLYLSMITVQFLGNQMQDWASTLEHSLVQVYR